MELRRVEAIVGEVVNEMEYLRRREQRLRDTNESTNERVKFFAVAVMVTLVAVGSWQVIYLRSYFRYVHDKRKSEGYILIHILSLGQNILFDLVGQ